MSEQEAAQGRSGDGGAAVPQLAAPGKFDFTKVTEWPRWLKRFERYRIASGLDKQSQEFQDWENSKSPTGLSSTQEQSHTPSQPHAECPFHCGIR
uniref:Uncharacterized protein n=1 Tax=Knipowitschia caucasica TaxID=637954 RepID=A0AAV2MM38_KNICA